MNYFKLSTEDIKALSTLAQENNCTNIEIPALLNFNDLSGLEDSIKSRMVKFVDSKGDIQVMNFDPTLSLAQIFSKNPDFVPQNKKVSYLAKTISNGPSRKINETSIWGVENYNPSRPENDANILLMGIQSLLSLNIKEFSIDIGSIEFIKGMLKCVPDRYKDKIIALIEDKNTYELNEYLKELQIPDIQRKKICEIPLVFGDYKISIQRAKDIVLNRESFDAILKLEAIYEIIASKGLSDYLKIDMGFTNTFHYYSGILFKGYVKECSKIIMQGGRYDSLMDSFNSSLQACGFSIDINNLKEAKSYDNVSGQQRSCS